MDHPPQTSTPNTPPADDIRLVDAPIDIGALYQAATHPSCGAVCCFVGTTRDHHDGRPVASLSYEAYADMALKELQRVADDLRQLHPDVVHLALVHRTGDVPITENSVAVVASSPHRRDAFAACQFGIDTLKARVPIWKKEFYRDDTAPRWVANHECCRPEGTQ